MAPFLQNYDHLLMARQGIFEPCCVSQCVCRSLFRPTKSDAFDSVLSLAAAGERVVALLKL